MNLLLGIEALVLFLAAVLAGLGAWLAPEVTIRTNPVPELAVRVTLSILAAAFLGGSGACLALWRQRQGLSSPLKQPGPRGLVFITPHTVVQLAVGLLAQELPETTFRVHLQPQKEGFSLRVFLRLPQEASITEVAERVQELLTAELSRRTGLKVQEVQVVVHGTARAPR
ncbi:hypothetical protein H5T56_02830 [Candidatus Bipolaricaulota bacterium]|nr:hypothetical protein [Candidatus Bipolaricaulota bacterium]